MQREAKPHIYIKTGFENKSKKHISNLKGKKKNTTVFVLEGMSLEMFSIPYDQVGKL